ncbi:histidine phosphatase family protein [Paenibacillus silvae]|uniref:histidine phosphatase family protein n=1 Tax=Paenibacillus silvae TaxID=1325358 RepID=UPI0025A13FC4|nr:histidine phosphatase family protein [Paenibacillus silvae]MDM5278137.1 histidine phosphatase family protein [Paenibacillus silvae]
MSQEAHTRLYFVRHAESRYVEGRERERGLTEQGCLDARKIANLMQQEAVDIFYSSPYLRAVQTIQIWAEFCGKTVCMEEDLRERTLSGPHVKHEHFHEAKRRLYLDASFAFPGGESGQQARTRAISVIERIVQKYAGQSIVIGTHGDVMTLIFQHFDPAYGFEFWESTTMPDIYRLDLDRNHHMLRIARMWK